ncbi:MAG: hypothetical protein RL196_1519 [Actinomycetota bacterium]|jgi:ABC-type multidrug transport system fused ATPase/permease subunit
MILRSLISLFSRKTKAKLVAVMLGYALLSLLDIIGIVALIPLMSLLTAPTAAGAQATYTGVSQTAWQLLGRPETPQFALEIAIIVAFAFTFKAAFGVTFRWWSLTFLAKEQTETTVGLFESFLRAPFEEHRRTSSTEIMHSVNWVTLSAFTGITTLITFFGESFTVFAVLISLFLLNPMVAIVVIALFGGVGGGFQMIIRRRNKAAAEAGQRYQAASTKAINQGLGGVKEIILRNNPGPFLTAFEIAEQRKNVSTRTKALYSDLPKYFFEVLLVCGVAAISAYLFSIGASGQMLSTLAIFGAAGFRLLPSVTRMLASLNGYLYAKPSIEKLYGDITRLRENQLKVGTPGLVEYSGAIEISDVSYEYIDANPVLQAIDLVVPAGSSLALVGLSGAGKTTLVDLLLGLQKPTTGQITCGGINIHKNLIDWQTKIGLVPQDVFLMDATLRENIVFDVDVNDVDQELLNQTVKLARLESLVASSPDGLDLLVGERGVRLSGGQRQRIAIARALYKKPSVLILDEATSALDNETEKQITETISNLAGEISVIVVAHRLSTVRNCDQFLVLHEGKMDALGTFDHVRNTSKVFANLAKLASL